MMWSERKGLLESAAAAKVVRGALRSAGEFVDFPDDKMPHWVQGREIKVDHCWLCGANPYKFAEKVSEFPNPIYGTLCGDFGFPPGRLGSDFDDGKIQLVIFFKSTSPDSQTIDICLYIPKEEI